MGNHVLLSHSCSLKGHKIKLTIQFLLDGLLGHKGFSRRGWISDDLFDSMDLILWTCFYGLVSMNKKSHVMRQSIQSTAFITPELKSQVGTWEFPEPEQSQNRVDQSLLECHYLQHC